MSDCGDCKSGCGINPNKIPHYEGVGGTLWIVSTRLCNFACAYCYQGSDHSWKPWQKEAKLKKQIDDETLARTLNFARLWASENFKIVWYGGEPLLTWDTIKKWTPTFKRELESYQRKLQISITTNGSLLGPEQRSFIDDYDMGILFSLDGPPWLHNQTRVLAGGRPSWDTIPVEEIIKWRPTIDIAWQISPGKVPEPKDLDWMVEKGFQRINFNIDWLKDWSLEDQQKLTKFMYYVISCAIQEKRNGGTFRTNWLSKIEKLVRKSGERETKPCGTSLGMLAVTPEGHLYPSQEMAFSAFEPNKAPGTAEYYRVGNVHQVPVLNHERLEGIMDLTNDEMIPPAGYDCAACPVRSISFGGCHCRYVGENGADPRSRHHVAPGWCPSLIAAATGGLQAFARYGYVELKNEQKSSAMFRQPTNKKVARSPLSIVDLDGKLDKIINILEK